jgi:hypothetical protein
MFEYIDHCFPSSQYNKLVCHFTINEIQFAERSVDLRMASEMQAGRQALTMLRKVQDSDDNQAVREQHHAVVAANQGGPYGSAQLAAVLKASSDVWERISGACDEKDYASKINRDQGWFKARFEITASDQQAWTAKAHGSNNDESSIVPCSFKFTTRKREREK